MPARAIRGRGAFDAKEGSRALQRRPDRDPQGGRRAGRQQRLRHAVPRPATPCCSTPRTSTTSSLSSVTVSTCGASSRPMVIGITSRRSRRSATRVSVRVTADDAGMLPRYDDVIEDPSAILDRDVRLHTILTPGHTAGSMCFLVEGSPVLFSGDTLFPRRSGYHDFPGGDFGQDHRVDRPPPVHLAGGHPRVSRARRRHNDRLRTAPLAGVDRPALVTGDDPEQGGAA